MGAVTYAVLSAKLIVRDLSLDPGNEGFTTGSKFLFFGAATYRPTLDTMVDATLPVSGDFKAKMTLRESDDGLPEAVVDWFEHKPLQKVHWKGSVFRSIFKVMDDEKGMLG